MIGGVTLLARSPIAAPSNAYAEREPFLSAFLILDPDMGERTAPELDGRRLQIAVQEAYKCPRLTEAHTGDQGHNLMASRDPSPASSQLSGTHTPLSTPGRSPLDPLTASSWLAAPLPPPSSAAFASSPPGSLRAAAKPVWPAEGAEAPGAPEAWPGADSGADTGALPTPCAGEPLALASRGEAGTGTGVASPGPLCGARGAWAEETAQSACRARAQARPGEWQVAGSGRGGAAEEEEAACAASAPPAPRPGGEDLSALAAVMLAQESALAAGPDCLARHAPGACGVAPGEGVTADMRRSLVCWLVQVSLEYGLHEETLFLGLSAMDRALAALPGGAAPRSRLQVLGAAALLLACKHEEEAHPALADWVELSDRAFDVEGLRRAEGRVLQAANFQLHVPTPLAFLCLLRAGAGLEPRTCALATYLLALAALEAGALAWKPSQLAAAAAALACLYQHQARALGLVAAAAGAPREALLAPAAALLELQRLAFAERDARSAYVPVRDKFRAHEWCGVATVTPFAKLPAALLLGRVQP